MPSSKVVLKMADGEIGNLRQGLYPCSESVLTLPVWPSMKLTVNRPCCLFPCSELSAQAKQLHVPQSIFPRGTRIKRARRKKKQWVRFYKRNPYERKLGNELEIEEERRVRFYKRNSRRKLHKELEERWVARFSKRSILTRRHSYSRFYAGIEVCLQCSLRQRK